MLNGSLIDGHLNAIRSREKDATRHIHEAEVQAAATLEAVREDRELYPHIEELLQSYLGGQGKLPSCGGTGSSSVRRGRISVLVVSTRFMTKFLKCSTRGDAQNAQAILPKT